ncbi:hypothetical protein QFZ60_003123 [Arthrobacter sp. B2I5]|uniref:DUF2306 domain-containing protein n=1 Tax=Arthrobacter sp. B2I5 TaxID=3042266 RepID=UPI00278AB077|nr:DUF2306 domain-containing protein [Arthrobacter sp. B2I5]MDQ0826950.1 hypothetical protein [Arthrobacter sp. B2I5]
MNIAAIPRSRPAPKARWFVPAGLILLSLVPILAGTLRLTQLAGGKITPDNARFFDSPLPVLIHIPTVTLYLVLGAFQFVPPLRRGKRGRASWHKVAGRILAPTGLLAALSGLWMAVFYDLPPLDGPLLLALRLVFGSAMAAFIVLGFIAVRRRNYVRHSEWMSRAYAIGIAQGTIVVVTLPWIALVGPVTELSRALLIGASWVLSLAVAEYFIHRRARGPAPGGQLLRDGAAGPDQPAIT